MSSILISQVSVVGDSVLFVLDQRYVCIYVFNRTIKTMTVIGSTSELLVVELQSVFRLFFYLSC